MRIFSARNRDGGSVVYLRGDIRQIQSLFHCGVAAADHRHFLVAIEESVAGSARETPRPLKASSEGRPSGGSAGGDDRASQVYSPLSPVRRNGRFCKSTRLIWSKMISVSNFAACSCMRSISSGPVRSFGSPVFHFRRGGQLTAFFHPGDQHRLQVGACGIDRRGVSRRSRTKDKQFTVFGCAHEIPIIIGIHWAGIGNLLS